MKVNRILGLVISMLGVFLVGSSYGQMVGNEWINYNQSYWKFRTAEDGIYRITRADLQAAGFPIATVNPRHIQIFHKGKEQAIWIQGENDGSFDANDVIYFYGRRNTGEQDAELYRPLEAQSHQYYNLYTDSAAFFITFSLEGQNGKRMQRESFGNTSIAGLPLVQEVQGEAFRLETTTFYAGTTYSMTGVSNIFMSWMDFGSGFMGTQIRRNEGRNHAITGIDNLVKQGTKPKLELMLIGRNLVRHTPEILVGPNNSNLRSLGVFEYQNHDAFTLNFDLEFSDFAEDGQLVVRVVSRGIGVSQDLNCPAYFLVHYPRTFSEANQELMLIPPQNQRRRVTLNAAANLLEVFDISDKDDPKILPKNTAAGSIQHIGIAVSNKERRLMKTSIEDVKTIRSFQAVPFQPINFEQFNFFIISNKLLRVPADGYQDPVEAYRAYRASPDGGAYRSIALNIDELFNQFSYGEENAMAVYRVTREIYRRAENPSLFLIGKPISLRFRPYRSGNTTINNTDFVPTAGEPLSDNLYSFGLGGDDRIPYVPTGRLAARTAREVAAYLDKVKEYDQWKFDDLSRKNILHLSGGATVPELNAFRIFLNSFATIAEGPFMGARSTRVGKRTTNSVELINISQEVNEGVSLITFFGHSGAEVADIDVGFVSDDGFGYRNKGKYPIMIVNGCDAGNFATSTRTFGEDWMVTRDRGAVGFIAHSHVGITSQLRRSTDLIYRYGLADSTYIDTSIGQVILKSFSEMIIGRNSNVGDEAHVQQTNFQGDPLLRLFPAEKPDYAIIENQIHLQTFDESPRVTLELDSFRVGIPVKNLGRALLQELDLLVYRTLPDGRIEELPNLTTANIFNLDTLYFTFQSQPEEIPGLNSISIRLDPEDRIAELRKDNNAAIFSFEMKRSGTLNMFPVNFSIEPESQLTLVVQSADILGGERDFEIELDTTRFFNSPAKRQVIQKADGRLKWEQNLLPLQANPDTTAIFWRSRFADPRAEEDTTWTESTFSLVPQSPRGWAQVHPQQFDFNNTPGMTFNDAQRQWEFETTETAIEIRTFGGSHPDFGRFDVDVLIGGLQLIISASYGACRNNTMNAVAFDQFSTEPYRVLQYNQFEVLDPASCGRIPSVINNMIQNDINGNRRIIENYIARVKDGDPVVFFSIGNVQYGTWRQQTYDAFASIGLDGERVRNLRVGEPVIIFGRKGAEIGEAIMITTSDTDFARSEISLSQTINGRFGNGRFITPSIGQALVWQTASLKFESRNNAEQFSLSVFGLPQGGGQEQRLQQNLTSGTINLSNISASQYPAIRLEGNFVNESTFTAPLLRHWMLFFDPLPDGTLYFREQATGNSIVQGTPFQYPMEFFNVSSGTFRDSVLVEYTVINRSSGSKVEDSFLIPAPNPGKGSAFTIPVNTLTYLGVNDLEIVVNDQLQMESDFTNNRLFIPNFLTVTPDRVNPLVDVAFDGQYIMDGDLVSSRPLISIELRDDNRFIQKKDTSGIAIAIKKPCLSCGFQPIPFSSPDIQWFPASENSPYRIEYRPEFMEDGMHSLQVQAADAAGNLAGVQPFAINFEVSTESAITHFYPYPNPFSTSTRFVFTLSGAELPDNLSIQIMTVSGKVVREIGMDEIGPIRFGNNISEFAWDGTDQFGDRLANGVYFYRVRVQQAGNEMARRSTSADRAFKNGYGKLYILR